VNDWLHGFVLPLVAGGDVRVRGAMGAVELKALLDEDFSREAAAEQVAEARHQVAAELWIDAIRPPLDDQALRLALAIQNLLFLSHPEAQSLSVTRSRRRKVAHYATLAASLPEARDFPELVARHSMIHHLFDLGRDDVRVSFWAGRREYRGAEPPGRLLKWPSLRRVREERWRVGVVAEAVADPQQREIVLALVAASPLTDLLEPTRLEPRFDLKRTVKWLRDPLAARAVADRYLVLGLEQVGPALSMALIELFNQKDSRVESQLATRFLCHLQLLALLGESHSNESTRRIRMDTLVAHQEQLRDFYGLFAAAQRIGVGRPPDVTRDPRLLALVESHARLCTAVCGPARVLELTEVMSRGVGELALAS
jgi:hypothetical protein